MKAAIYARVSTDKQGRDQTVDSQLEALRRWATSHGHELKDDHVYIDEGYSGARLDRPALDRLRDAAREGEFDVLGVYSPDRLARRYAYQVLLLEELRKASCEVEFIERPISDDPHDQILLQIQGAIAEYERAVLGERFRRGKLQKARAGHWIAGQAPYGYRYVPNRDGVPGHLEIEEAEAEVVRMLYRWLIDERMTVRQILKRLASGPWRPRNGKRLWSNSVVHRVLSDPLYSGTAYANRHVLVAPRRPRAAGPRAGQPTCRKDRPREEWIPIPVPAIVDAMSYQDASEQLARNSALSFRDNARNDYLLRCLLTCRTCGLAMCGVTTSGARGRRRHRYYMCHGKDTLSRDRAHPCPQPRPRAEELDAAVWDHVKRLLDDPSTLAAQFEERARQADSLDADARVAGLKWEAQLRRLDREEQRLLDAYQAEAIDLDELKRRREQINSRKHLLSMQRDQEQRLRSERQTAKEVWADLTAFCERVRSRLDEATLAERQRILQLLIDRVIVGEDTLEIRHVIPLGRLKAEPASPCPTDPTGSGGGEGDEPEVAMPSGLGARLRTDGVILAVAMRHVGEFRRDPGHERVLPVRQPQDHGQAQGLGPVLGLEDQASHLVGRGRDQRLGEPDPLPGQLADDVEGLVALLGLEAVDREDDLGGRGVFPPQDVGVLLTRRDDDLIEPNGSGDRVLRDLDRIRVGELGPDLRDRPVPREPPLTDPAEDVPADGPMRQGDHALLFGALGLGMSGTVAVGAVVELADQFDGPLEGVEPPLAMVADMHHAAAEGTIAIDDVEFPGSEFQILGPDERHGAALRAVSDREQNDEPILSLCSKDRDF
jgi:site-specific DNA recombinase